MAAGDTVISNRGNLGDWTIENSVYNANLQVGEKNNVMQIGKASLATIMTVVGEKLRNQSAAITEDTNQLTSINQLLTEISSSDPSKQWLASNLVQAQSYNDQLIQAGITLPPPDSVVVPINGVPTALNYPAIDRSAFAGNSNGQTPTPIGFKSPSLVYDSTNSRYYIASGSGPLSFLTFTGISSTSISKPFLLQPTASQFADIQSSLKTSIDSLSQISQTKQLYINDLMSTFKSLEQMLSDFMRRKEKDMRTALGG